MPSPSHCRSRRSSPDSTARVPPLLGCYPSLLHRLALEARAGRLHIAPRLLTCSTEPLPAETRRVIEDVFGAPVIDAYGASENWCLAISSPGSPNLHLIEDVSVCEPVDRAGRPVPPGQTSSALLITNVINRVLPLIRYELTDEVTFLEEPNPGPWAGRRIAPVEGRRDHVFTYAGGVDVHPHVFRSALTRLPEVWRVSGAPDAARGRYCRAGHARRGAGQRARQIWSRRCGSWAWSIRVSRSRRWTISHEWPRQAS